MLYGILFITLFLAILSRLGNGKYNKQFFALTVIILILYCGLRDPFLYPDNGGYYDYFKGYTGDFEESFGIGYTTLNYISNFFSSSFYFFLMIVSAIIVSSYANAITKYSPYIWFSLFLYLIISYYPSFFLLRQYLAMAVFLYSIKYVVTRNSIKYGICMIIALSLHLTAVIAIPFYFLYGVKYSKKNMILLFAGSLAVIFLFMGLQSIVGILSAYYMKYFDMENESAAWQRAVMKVYILIVFLYALKKDFYRQGVNRVVFFSMFLNVIICIAAMNIFGVFRLREYFALADFIGVPVIIKHTMTFRKNKRPIVISLVLVYLILLLMSFDSFVKGDNMNDAYQFFWESSIYRTIK